MSFPDSSASVERQLGQLDASLKAVAAVLDRMQRSAERDEDLNRKSREGIYNQLREMSGRMASVEVSVVTVQQDIAEFKPIVADAAALEAKIDSVSNGLRGVKAVTDEVVRLKLMGLGALSVIGLVGLALGVSLSDFLRRLIAFVIGR